MTDTKIRLKIIREISLKADGFYHQAEELGQVAAQNEEIDTTGNEKKRKHRSQVTNLENIANNALKVSDVLNYLKTQTARREYWQKRDLGKNLLKIVNVNLLEDRRQICAVLNLPADQGEGQLIHLYLIREFVRQFAAQYEYCCMQMETERS